MILLTPALGKKYETAKGALADFESGGSFIFNDENHLWDGLSCEIDDLDGQIVEIKYREDHSPLTYIVRNHE